MVIKGLLRVALVVVLAAVVTVPLDAARAGGIVDDIIETYGGLEVLRKAGMMRQTGQIEDKVRGSDRPGYLQRVFDMPGKFRIEKDFLGENATIEILDGVQAWQNGVPVTLDKRNQMVTELARVAMPQILFAEGVRVEDRGVLSGAGGRSWHMLLVTLPQNLRMSVFLEPGQGLVRWARGSVEIGGKKIQYATEYKNYKKLGGMMTATRQEYYLDGKHVSSVTLDEVTLLFSPPRDAFLP